MRKAFACAFVLFMFASSTTALAGTKRFCGFIAPNETEVGGVEGATTLAAGACVDKDDYPFGAFMDTCNNVIKRIKEKLKNRKSDVGEGGGRYWTKHDWRKKDGYKCGKISDFFTDGANICGKKGKMEECTQGDANHYFIYKNGDNPASYELFGSFN